VRREQHQARRATAGYLSSFLGKGHVFGAEISDRKEAFMTTVAVRYMVHNVDEAMTFYTQHLGFQVEMHPGPGFASLSRGNLRLLLSALGGSGGAARSMPDGQRPEPGGWNRIQIEVDNLADLVSTLRKSEAHFRNDIVSGNGGKQILLDDPSGNPIELFEPYRG
jgi:catechol 2,3-dioxygenase-like lactoylglutathione lyase family enzyme